MSDHKPSDRRRGSEDRDISLNLLPFMNLMTLLIPFLLMSAQFVTLAVIDSSLPAIGNPDPAKEKKEDEKPPLNLTVGITEEGFTVAGSAAVLGYGSMQSHDLWPFVGGSIFVVLALVSLNRTLTRLGRFFKTGSIIRRIQAEEDGSGD